MLQNSRRNLNTDAWVSLWADWIQISQGGSQAFRPILWVLLPHPKIRNSLLCGILGKSECPVSSPDAPPLALETQNQGWVR